MRQRVLKTIAALIAALPLLQPIAARADDASDVVVLTDGDRLSGVVIAEDSQGVRIRLSDGSVRSLAPNQILEVRYHGEPNPLPVVPDLTPDPRTGTAVFPTPQTSVPIIPIPSPAAPDETADESPEPARKKGVRKFERGVRLGVALPMGNFVADGTGTASTALSGVFAVKIPMLIEAGYDVTPHVMLGFHVQYGIIVDKSGDSACPSESSCSDHDIELGIEGQYHFAPGRAIDAWVGLGLGYELEGETITLEGQSQNYSLGGPQFLKLQGGADLQVGRVMTVGPFMSFSLAEYTEETGGDIAAPALHEWLSLGVKGTFKVGD